MPSTPPATTGHLYGVGLGPGDPELITHKATRIINNADVIAYHTAKPGQSIARTIAAAHIPTNIIEEELCYPVTTGHTNHKDGYRGALNEFYSDCANRLAHHLDHGRTVAVISEGDPFIYGSYQHLHRRLAHRYPTTVIPGIPSFVAAAAALGTPLVEHQQVLSVLPGTLPQEQLVQHLGRSDAAVVLKLGRTFKPVTQALADVGKLNTAHYAERVGHPSQRLDALADVASDSVPYMSVAVAPGVVPDYYPTTEIAPPPAALPQQKTPEKPATGEVVVLGLGPGPEEWLTPATAKELAQAEHIIGYTSYTNRVPLRAGQQIHASDNQVEEDRARHALTLAQAGHRVAVVSSGDPGVFAMAAAVVEVAAEPEFLTVPVRVEPGVSAAQAAAARVGAPLGHDFAMISLSDRLKPWSVIVQRLHACAQADLAMALYNPASRSRKTQFAEAKSVLLTVKAPDTPVIVAKSVGRPGELVQVMTLADVDPATITMAHLVIVGTTHTRVVPGPRGARVWTSRRYSVSEN